MRKTLIYTLLFVTLSSFMPMSQQYKNDKLARRAMRSFMKKMECRGYHSYGIGEGEYAYQKNFFCMMFQTEQVLSIESARRLGVQAVNDFLSHINSTKNIRDCLIQYPLTEQFVEIMIRGEDLSSDNSNLVLVMAGGGKVCYKSNSLMPPSYGVIYQETFEEAERILREEQGKPVIGFTKGKPIAPSEGSR